MGIGIYRAVKDVAMQTGGSAWLLMEGETLEVVQIDNDRKRR